MSDKLIDPEEDIDIEEDWGPSGDDGVSDD